MPLIRKDRHPIAGGVHILAAQVDVEYEIIAEKIRFPLDFQISAIACGILGDGLQSASSSTAGIRSRRRSSPRDAQALPRLTESSKTSNLPMRTQSAVSKLSAKLSPAYGMRKLRRKTPIRNRSARCASKQALPSMTRWMILARLGAVRISIGSQRLFW